MLVWNTVVSAVRSELFGEHAQDARSPHRLPAFANGYPVPR